MHVRSGASQKCVFFVDFTCTDVLRCRIDFVHCRKTLSSYPCRVVPNYHIQILFEAVISFEIKGIA